MTRRTATPHHVAITIGSHDIDFMGHANNASYLSWVQAAIIDHWNQHAPADAIATLRWVALTHRIAYCRPAFRAEEVVATVSLQRVVGARAFYTTVVRRCEEVLATVRSCWCCVDAATMRPTRLTRDVVDRFFV